MRTWLTGHTGELEEDKELELAVGHRLAFREFGAVMGLKCYDDLREQDYWKFWIGKVMKVWRQAGQVPTPSAEVATMPTLQKLAPITLVMFCAALEPGGGLIIFFFRKHRQLIMRQRFGRGLFERLICKKHSLLYIKTISIRVIV